MPAVGEPASACEEASDWDAGATVAPDLPELPVIVLAPGPTLEQVARSGVARGMDEHAAIAAHGLAGDDLWEWLSGTPGAEKD